MDGLLSIDISKDVLDTRLCVGSTKETDLRQVSRSVKGLKELYRQIKDEGIKKLYVCMEATGDYWRMVADFFYGKKKSVVFVVNPARIKAQRKTEQKRSKTDRIDAGVILRFLKANLQELKAWSPPSKEVRKLQDLVRFRDLLVRQRASLKNLLKS